MCLPYGFHVVAKILSPFQFPHWQMWLENKAHKKVGQLGLRGNPRNVIKKMLTGICINRLSVARYTSFTSPQVRNAAMAACMKTDVKSDLGSSSIQNI